MVATSATVSKQDAALHRLRSSPTYFTRYCKAYIATRRNMRQVQVSNTLREFLGHVRRHNPHEATADPEDEQYDPFGDSVPPANKTPRPTISFRLSQSSNPKICVVPAPRTFEPSLYARYPGNVDPNKPMITLTKQLTMIAVQVARWRRYVDTTEGATVSVKIRLKDLENRSNCKTSFERAVMMSEILKSPDIEAQSTSGYWVDLDGKPLVAYFGERWFNGKPIHDGVPERCMRRKHLFTQMLFHAQPKRLKKAKLADERHPKDQVVMEYFVEGEDRPRYEAQGLRHDCLWSVRGNPAKGLLPSKDTHSSTATAAVATRALLYADDDLTALLREMVRVAFPDEFQHLASSFEAGTWNGIPLPKGPNGVPIPLPGGVFLGRATLWKLQTSLHLDKKDVLCAIVCSGEFTGGEALLPDISVKLSYRPRHIIIFRSNCLYHEVNEWKPTVMKDNASLTPGRVAYSYFTHKDALKILKDKPAGWYTKTGGGKYPFAL